MTRAYDDIIAGHYAAYRPPLHELILKRSLAGVGRFHDGLDVGCGTGRSSVALADFCHHVIAIDSSQSMLEAAPPHSNITFRHGCAENLPLADHSVDVITFAGSLFYADFDATVGEVVRVGRGDALVITYDFNVPVEDLLRRFGVALHEQDSGYDHAANFSGVSCFKETLAKQERITLELFAADLAHLLLADPARHAAFADRYGTATPVRRLAGDLGPSDAAISIAAEIYYSAYRINARR